MSETVLFQTIQFSISTQFSSIWPIDRTQSSATTLGQSGPGSNGNKGVLHIPPKLQHYWNLTIRLFNVIPRQLLGRFYPSAEKQSVYSTAPADWATVLYCIFVLHCIFVLYCIFVIYWIFVLYYIFVLYSTFVLYCINMCYPNICGLQCCILKLIRGGPMA